MKVPDSSDVTEHACMRRHMAIGRADPYEQVGREAGLRIWAAIVRARSAEQSTFIDCNVCFSMRKSRTAAM